MKGRQVMLAQDLAELYQVNTKALNQQVKRNIGKFPDRDMFQLTEDEYYRLRSQNVTLKRGQQLKYMPFAFTEHGILMLSSVLNSALPCFANRSFSKGWCHFLTSHALKYDISIISKTVSSLARFKMTMSPVFLLINAFARGEMNEIFPLDMSASSTPTI